MTRFLCVTVLVVQELIDQAGLELTDPTVSPPEQDWDLKTCLEAYKGQLNSLKLSVMPKKEEPEETSSGAVFLNLPNARTFPHDVVNPHP